MSEIPSFRERLRAALGRVCYRIYTFEYALGMYTVTFLRRGYRWLRREMQPMFGWLNHFAVQPVRAYLRSVLTRLHTFKRVVQQEFDRPKASFKQPFAALRDRGRCVWGVARRYPAILGRVLSVAAPVAAFVLLILTVQYWSSATFGIRVEYEGEDIGFVSAETVYHEAADLARDRVYSEDGEFTISDAPRLSVSLTSPRAMLDTNALCDAILRTKGDAISDGCGLYVDGEFVGSMHSRKDMDAVLDAIKSVYLNGNANERAEFIQKVEVVDGLFLSETVMTADQMKQRLTEQAVVKKEYTVQDGDVMGSIARKLDMTLSALRAMNPQVKDDIIREGQKLTVQLPQPFLRVKVIRTIEYEEKIDYDIVKKKDNTKYTTYEKVEVKGVEGSQNVVAEITFVDGVEQSRTILSINVTKQPVSKVVIVGTKPVYANGSEITQGDGKTTGSMTWPVPSCHTLSRGWRRGHYALDINGPGINGKPIVAADGGTVISAGWNTGGYGYLIVIQHAGGLQTWYAHCSALNVVTGQKVTRGQMIGRVGNSGYSTGAHLHFEVRKNGIRVNPTNYL